MGFFTDYNPLSARPYWFDDLTVRLHTRCIRKSMLSSELLEVDNLLKYLTGLGLPVAAQVGEVDMLLH